MHEVLHASFNLSRSQILDIMKKDVILVQDVLYDVPWNQLVECLRFRKYGLIDLELTKA
jgi:hypothetical protein